MKKLMFAIAAVAAMVAVAEEAPVASQIVGFEENALPNDGLAVGPAFIAVGGGTTDLMDITVTGYDPFDYDSEEGGAYGDVQVQTLTGGGSTDTIYAWQDFVEKGETPDEDVVWKGWYNEETPLARGEVVLAEGEGLWSVTLIEDMKLQSKGEVVTDADISLELPNDGLMIANPTPISVDLINCYVTGYDPFDYASEEGGAYGDVQVQTLTGGGSTDTIYAWQDFVEKGETPDEDVVWHGWYNEETPLAAKEVVLAPGEGLWSVTLIESMTFNWPKVYIVK